MSDNIVVKAVAGTCAAFSFILVGNAITQTYMTVPALLVDFPAPGKPDQLQRARTLGRQWPLCWTVGNIFFRPISSAGVLGYGFAAFSILREGHSARGSWQAFAIAAALHLSTVLHSALNMQPLNAKLEALATTPNEKALHEAEGVARKWASWNRVRLITPLLAGSLALWQLVA